MMTSGRMAPSNAALRDVREGTSMFLSDNARNLSRRYDIHARRPVRRVNRRRCSMALEPRLNAADACPRGRP